MNRLLVLVFLVCAGCSTVPSPSALPVIHPKVFTLVECWLSDTAQPVATEINLDAVRRDRNQFDYDAIRTDGDWVRAKEGKESWRYRVLERHGSDFVIEFQANGGGSLTTSSKIGYTLMTRRVEVDGRARDIQVIRINRVEARR